MFKIKRTLTYNFTEEEVRDFFDTEYWEDVTYIDKEEFDYFEDSLIDKEYDDEEFVYVGDTEEQMKKIWEEERDKAIKSLKEEDKKDYRGTIEDEILNLEARLDYLRAKLEELDA